MTPSSISLLGRGLARVGAPHRRVPGACASELSDVGACLFHGHVQVKPVGPAPARGKRGQSVRGAVEEPLSANLIAASRMRHGNTHLCKPLPQISLLGWPRLPTRLQNLMSRERTASRHERSGCRKRLNRRQRLLRHRRDPRSAIWQRPAQSIARPSLASAALGVPVTITSSHTISLPAGGTRSAVRDVDDQRGNRESPVRICRASHVPRRASHRHPSDVKRRVRGA